MSDNPFEPFRHPTMSIDDQRAATKALARDATLALDFWVINHRDELISEVTAASRTALEVEAVIGYLIGLNLVSPTTDGGSEWLPVEIPEHLRPDIEAAKAQYRRYRAMQP